MESASNLRQAAIISLQRRKTENCHDHNNNSSCSTEHTHTIPNLVEEFGSNVFGDKEVRASLPGKTYKEFQEMMKGNKPLTEVVADQVANAMKEWAIKKGATHYCHWFQPLTGLTAEKHDSFLNFNGGKVMMEFSGKELIKGEPDASSFPNGGIRSTFEARGYTAWDMRSPVFVRKTRSGVVLCIPTAFCSWTGEALDQKTPLLRSEEALNKQALRVLRLMGDNQVRKVTCTLGAEQEFFLVDRAFYLARPDLVVAGRTVMGAKPPKGQEMEDHYFGSIHPRILACMQEIEWESWKLGLPLKTRHNEVAPAQYEISPIFEDGPLAADHNMLLMEILKDVAEKHGFVCLLHEKPFQGVNGSGKHNNWSAQTDRGENLLEPGKTPGQNARFIVFLTAVIRAVDEYSELLRCSIVTPGNDYRLGGNEAPPSIISVYLGEELDSVCRNLISAHKNSEDTAREDKLRLGVSTLPYLPRDTSDRNRTSPFAFTGNKFEFRAVGSSQSISRPVFILNTIVADALRSMADDIEKQLETHTDKPRDAVIQSVVQSTLEKYYRIVFNGNGYSKEWEIEAQNRGLSILRTTPEALAVMDSQKNIDVFHRLSVMSPIEARSQTIVLIEQYVKAMTIEAQVCTSMARNHVLPAAIKYQAQLSSSLRSTKEVLDVDTKGLAEILEPQVSMLRLIATKIGQLIATLDKLTEAASNGEKIEDHLEQAVFFKETVCQEMQNTRDICDWLETVVDDSLWTLPKYSEMLFLR